MLLLLLLFSLFAYVQYAPISLLLFLIGHLCAHFLCNEVVWEAERLVLPRQSLLDQSVKIFRLHGSACASMLRATSLFVTNDAIVLLGRRRQPFSLSHVLIDLIFDLLCVKYLRAKL